MQLFYNVFKIAFFTLLSSSFLQAQITLKGKVQDAETGEELIGAAISLGQNQGGTNTDYNGEFVLKVAALPVQLRVTYTGYTPFELTVQDANQRLSIKLSSSEVLIEELVIKGQRIDDKQKAAPLTVENLDAIAIKETPAVSFYNGLGNLKGVDLTTASLGVTVINMRGFNSTSPVRSLQIIDGVDNQAPGLNFSLGNFLGSSDLDVAGVDLVVGASSAFYGPNAFNGVISMKTKNPFIHRGLSVSLKGGERSLLEGAARYAESFKNKDGKFEDSNKAVQKLAKDYSGYKYFGAKGLIVMAKNYYQLKDDFSATSILESVIKNFSTFTDVVTEAQTELSIIKGEISKTNSSITN